MTDRLRAFRMLGEHAPGVMMIMVWGMNSAQPRLRYRTASRQEARNMIAFMRDLEREGFQDCTFWKRAPRWLLEEWGA